MTKIRPGALTRTLKSQHSEELRQKDQRNKFQTSLGYRAKPCLRRKEEKKLKEGTNEEGTEMEKREGRLVLSHSFDNHFLFPIMLFTWPSQHSMQLVKCLSSA